MLPLGPQGQYGSEHLPGCLSPRSILRTNYKTNKRAETLQVKEKAELGEEGGGGCLSTSRASSELGSGDFSITF